MADGSDEETQRSPPDEDPVAASFELHEEEYENEVGDNEGAENDEARRQSQWWSAINDICNDDQ